MYVHVHVYAYVNKKSTTKDNSDTSVTSISTRPQSCDYSLDNDNESTCTSKIIHSIFETNGPDLKVNKLFTYLAQ